MLLLAPPGAGKGTQGVRIAEAYGIEHLASGDLLRAEVAAGTDLGRKAKAYMDRGDLVPDDLVSAMVLNAVLSAPDGWVLDGFPRTLAQAEASSDWARERGLTFHAVVYLDVPEGELVERLLGRAKIEGRADDDEPTIRNRLEVFKRETAPLADYYRGRDVLVQVDATGSVDDVTERVLAALKPYE
jgi:adenylate kinase